MGGFGNVSFAHSLLFCFLFAIFMEYISGRNNAVRWDCYFVSAFLFTVFVRHIIAL